MNLVLQSSRWNWKHNVLVYFMCKLTYILKCNTLGPLLSAVLKASPFFTPSEKGFSFSTLCRSIWHSKKNVNMQEGAFNTGARDTGSYSRRKLYIRWWTMFSVVVLPDIHEFLKRNLIYLDRHVRIPFLNKNPPPPSLLSAVIIFEFIDKVNSIMFVTVGSSAAIP